MKGWLDNCQAVGGGDVPEAVADALDAVLKLSWRVKSTKICVLISDAPPHGLDQEGDTFPNGCPAGLDPARIVREMAEEHITLYSVGVEPPIGNALDISATISKLCFAFLFSSLSRFFYGISLYYWWTICSNGQFETFSKSNHWRST
jgi:hypothetical protein